MYKEAGNVLKACVSTIVIEYKEGHYQVLEGLTAISKHKNLQEAQLVRSILEKSLANDDD